MIAAYDTVTAAPENGEKGDPGRADLITRRLNWRPNFDFYSGKDNEEYLDLVKNGGYWYRCTTSHKSPALFNVKDGWKALSWFENLATGLLLADDAVITFLQNNKLVIEKEDGTITAGLSGNGNIRIWAGSNVPEKAPFRVDENGKVIAKNIELEGKVIATSGIFNGFVKIPYKKDNGIDVTLPTIDEGTNIMLTNRSGNLSLTLPTDLSYDGIQVEIMNAAFSVWTLTVYSPPYIPGQGLDLYWRSEAIRKIILLGDYSTVILKAFIAPFSNRLTWRIVNCSDFKRIRESEATGFTYVQWIQGY